MNKDILFEQQIYCQSFIARQEHRKNPNQHNNHVQHHGMFTIMTHFMAKHVLDDEMLKNGPGVIVIILNLIRFYTFSQR